MAIRDFLTELKMLYGRGSSWLSIIYNLATILTLVKVFYDYVSQYLSSMWIVYGSVLILVPVANILVGYVDQKWGIWKKENDYAYKVTPKADRMLQNTDNTLERLDSLEEKVENLGQGINNKLDQLIKKE